MMNMNKFIKTLLLAICLYVLTAKIYIAVYYVVNDRHDAAIQLVNFIVLCSCFYLPIIIMRKTYNLKYRIIWLLILFISIVLQLFYGLFDYFSRDVRSDTVQVLWTFDLPNLLSVFVIGCLMYFIGKNRSE